MKGREPYTRASAGVGVTLPLSWTTILTLLSSVESDYNHKYEYEQNSQFCEIRRVATWLGHA